MKAIIQNGNANIIFSFIRNIYHNLSFIVFVLKHCSLLDSSVRMGANQSAYAASAVTSSAPAVAPPKECPMHNDNSSNSNSITQPPPGHVPVQTSAKSYPSECPMHQGNAKPEPEVAREYPSECPMHQGNAGAAPKDDIDPLNMVGLEIWFSTCFVETQCILSRS